MKRSLYMVLAVAVAGAGLFAAPQYVSAHDGHTHTTETPRITAARCTIAKGRITNTTEAMKAVADRRTATYLKIQERTMTRVALLDQKGYDTTKLKADIEVFKAQIIDHRTKGAELYDILTKVQTVACDDADARFKMELSGAREKLESLRMSSEQIHTTMRTVIVPDIKTAAQWLKEN